MQKLSLKNMKVLWSIPHSFAAIAQMKTKAYAFLKTRKNEVSSLVPSFLLLAIFSNLITTKFLSLHPQKDTWHVGYFFGTK